MITMKVATPAHVPKVTQELTAKVSGKREIRNSFIYFRNESFTFLIVLIKVFVDGHQVPTIEMKNDGNEAAH